MNSVPWQVHWCQSSVRDGWDRATLGCEMHVCLDCNLGKTAMCRQPRQHDDHQEYEGVVVFRLVLPRVLTVITNVLHDPTLYST